MQVVFGFSKKEKKKEYRVLKYLLLCVFVVLASCNQDVQPINYGKEECAACKMTIMDKQFGAEIISTKGKVYKFDEVVCMIEFLSSQTISEDEVNRKLVINYEKENDFIDAEHASFYVGEDVHSPMNGNAAAFSTIQNAQKFQNGKQGVIMAWQEVYNKFN